MASSAEQRRRGGRPAAALGAAALALALAGCVSSEQRSAWLQVENARALATQSSTIVRRAAPEVKVTGTWLLRGHGQAAIAVRLRNRSGRALNDLPISVGLLRGGVRTYLNRRPGLDYFSTHVAAIPPATSETWVFSPAAGTASTGRPFAIVGSPDSTPTSVRGRLPLVRASLSRSDPGGPVTVIVRNLSSIPQAEVEIYALALRSGRFAAAGHATVTDLGAGESTSARLGLIGRSPGPHIELEALPTLFQ